MTRFAAHVGQHGSLALGRDGIATASKRPLPLRVVGGSFPKAFEIEISDLDLRLRWDNPRSGPKVIGADILPLFYVRRKDLQ